MGISAQKSNWEKEVGMEIKKIMMPGMILPELSGRICGTNA